MLARRVRFLSLEQLGRVVAPEAADRTRAGRVWAERCELARLVERFTVTAKPPAAPRWLACYEVGGGAPDFGALSRELRDRAAASEAERMQMVRLGENGAKLFGLRAPRVPRRSEASHDLQLAEVAVALSEESGGDAVAEWLSEDELVRRKAYHGVVPDAEVCFASGARVVVECGGSYSRGKLVRFHAALAPQLEARGVSGYRIV